MFGLLIFFICIGGACNTRTAETTAVQAADQIPSSSDREIDSALKLVAKSPDSTLGYNQLAVIYIKKARQTGDFNLNEKAEAAVKRALEIAPGDVPSRKLQASLSLTFHRFTEALELGMKLQHEFPKDPIVYGVLTDANAELGNYVEAVAAAQQMVDLKPNSSSYARVAHLRSLHGDHAGAVEMFTLAARITDPQDKEAQSWCLVQLADELWKNGKYPEAEKVYDEALQNFPEYFLALAGKGRIRAAQGDLETAERILVNAQNRVPNPETIVLLGDIYTVRGNAEKAANQYDLVEVVEQKLGVPEIRLALLWADRDVKLDEALGIATNAHAARKDIYTADVLAWCLYKKNRLAEAKAAIDEAMRLKTNDARIRYHAGMIELALGNEKEARVLLQMALKTNPVFDLLQAENARAALSKL